MPQTNAQRVLEPNQMNYEAHENSLYRLTHSTVEGRDSVNKSYTIHGHPRQPYDTFNDGNYQSGGLAPDRRYEDPQHYGTLQEGSFISNEQNDTYGQDNHRAIKANIKKLGYVMGTTVPQQEYKFVKEISNLVTRLTNNSSLIGAVYARDTATFPDYNPRDSAFPRPSTGLAPDSERMQGFRPSFPHMGMNQEIEQNNSISQQPGNIQEVLQDLQRLEEVFLEFPVSREHFMKRYGLTGLLDILEQIENAEIKEKVLQVVNTITFEDLVLQEKACLFGFLPYIIKYSSSEHPKDLRVQAARFLGRMPDANDLTFHMFLSAGGFRALVELLDIEYEKNRDLVGFAVEMLGMIFERKALPTKHLCKILVKLDVFHRLIIIIGSLYKDAKTSKDAQEAQVAEEFLLKCLDLMNNFAALEDGNIRDTIGQEGNLLALVLYFRKFECYSHMLSKASRILANLCTEPRVMERIQRIKLLPEVVKMIGKEANKQQGTDEEAITDLLRLLSQMCQLDARRQEEVVLHGGIEILIRVKQGRSKNVERLVSGPYNMRC